MSNNVNPIINKVETSIRIWSMRDLTVYGKVAVVNAHLQSQLLYQLAVLPSPPQTVLQNIEKFIFKHLC